MFQAKELAWMRRRMSNKNSDTVVANMCGVFNSSRQPHGEVVLLPPFCKGATEATKIAHSRPENPGSVVGP